MTDIEKSQQDFMASVGEPLTVRETASLLALGIFSISLVVGVIILVGFLVGSAR